MTMKYRTSWATIVLTTVTILGCSCATQREWGVRRYRCESFILYLQDASADPVIAGGGVRQPDINAVASNILLSIGVPLVAGASIQVDSTNGVFVMRNDVRVFPILESLFRGVDGDAWPFEVCSDM